MVPETITDNAPVENIDTGSKHEGVEEGMALCLSGGGYRAMLFHLGSLWRLNEFGYLPRLKRISSVSGGSITSATMGMNWKLLEFDTEGKAIKFEEFLVRPIRELASKTIDLKALIMGIFTPGSVSDKLASAYDKYLFKGKTLQNLPDGLPRFVINATNVQSGALWRFMKPYMRDWRVGEIKTPETPLAVAVAASSAFPPVLSPTNLKLDPSRFTAGSGAELQREPFTSDVVLTDGGVYDNLGLETAWKRYSTILVGDAGGKMQPEGKPKHNWFGHMLRVINLIDNQVRSLRKRQLIRSFINNEREGAYWGIRANIDKFHLDSALPCLVSKTIELAKYKTRLKRVEVEMQQKLINWGYAICDAAVRKHVDSNLQPAPKFPYPDVGVG